MTFGNKLAVPAWLVATDTTTWNFKGKRFLGSGLVVLVTANWPQLSGRHYAAHQFSKFVHVVFAGNIATQNLSQSLALDSNDGEHFKMRTFFDVDEALQVAKNIKKLRLTQWDCCTSQGFPCSTWSGLSIRFVAGSRALRKGHLLRRVFRKTGSK